MNAIWRKPPRNTLYGFLALVPVVSVAERRRPGARTVLFLLSVAAAIPLAALSRATACLLPGWRRTSP